ncbi:hybrid sensor histidine kinase/response regulator [bacterium]|nr:hybrid sensor histidine kinase/response regulator [bacterium]
MDNFLFQYFEYIETPILVLNTDWEILFQNTLFKSTLKEYNIDESSFLFFLKNNWNLFVGKLKKSYPLKRGGLVVYGNRDKETLFVSLQSIKPAFLEEIRKDIIHEFTMRFSHIFNNWVSIAQHFLNIFPEQRGKRELQELLKQMRDIIETLSLFSSSICGYINPNLYFIEDVINDALKKTEPIHKAQASLKKIEYIITIDVKESIQIDGDFDELSKALIQILKNSFEAMPKGGKLSINSYKNDRNRVVITIEDSGSGIDDESIFKVTEPFFTTKKMKRDGLGLTYALGVVKKHKGKIDINSSLQGTVVKIEIPVAQRVGILNFKERARTILVVDDEKIIADSVAKMLSKKGYNVIKAYSGTSGISLYKEHQSEIDIIISDYGMDSINGEDFSQYVKKEAYKNGVDKPYFMLYTGWGVQLKEQDLSPKGIDAIYSKPLSGEQFHEIIQNIRK